MYSLFVGPFENDAFSATDIEINWRGIPRLATRKMGDRSTIGKSLVISLGP
jgi:hypothetical protein